MTNQAPADPASNPLFDLPAKKDRVIAPLPADEVAKTEPDSQEAVNLIRQKIAALYTEEPSAEQELAEAEAVARRSKHQQFMYDLSNSGQSLAEIQTAWHNYYVSLPDDEKRQVWREFYSNYNKINRPIKSSQAVEPVQRHKVIRRVPARRTPDRRGLGEIKKQLLGKVKAQPVKQRPSYLKSLLFGLGAGSVVMLVMMFGFFNERFIAPFVTPSRHVTATPIIVDNNVNVSPEPKLIIPKINAELPVVYDEKSIAEEDVQRALERGVLHYPITVRPGVLGHGAIFGHSSNNILNRGDFKFAFVLLNRLEKGDTFMLHYQGKRYVYRVYDKRVVPPNDLSVLDHQGRPATMALITCDPPGTVLNRLVVFGEQISPDPAQNVASAVQPDQLERPAILPSDAPSLLSRIWSWLAG